MDKPAFFCLVISSIITSALCQDSTFQTYSGVDYTLTCSDLTNLEDDDTLQWKSTTPDLMKTIVVINNGRTTTWGERGFSIVNRVDLLIPKTIKGDSATYQCQITKASSVKVYTNTMSLEVKDVCALPVQSRELVRTTKGCHDSFIVEGEICSFFCKEGFQLDNDINITCLPSGQLSHPLPICLNVNCSVGKLPSNLIPKTELCLPNADVPFGTNCYFECKEGYQLVKGEFIRICQANATLSGNFGICKDYQWHYNQGVHRRYRRGSGQPEVRRRQRASDSTVQRQTPSQTPSAPPVLHPFRSDIEMVNYDDLSVRNRRSLTSSVSSTESLPESMQSSNPRDNYRVPRATTGTQSMLPGMYCTTLRRDTSAGHGGRVGGGQHERILPDRPIITSS